MPSNKLGSSARAAAKGVPIRASRTAKKPAAQRRAKSAADAAEAKHRRASEMLRQLRSDVDTLSANADRLLSRFPI